MAETGIKSKAERENKIMAPPYTGKSPVILTVIANWLMGDRVLAFAGMQHIDFAFISQGKGTVRKAYLREKGLSDLRKEIVTILTTRDSAYKILEDLKTEMHIEEPNSGIAFLSGTVDHAKLKEENKGGGAMENLASVDFRAIYVMVKKGFAENVISAGERAGTRGATVIAARGEAKEGKIPGLLISDDKEVILVITNQEKALKFMSEIEGDQEIMNQGQAKVFVTEILDTVGIQYF